MRTRDRDRDGDITHVELADTVHDGDSVGSQERRCFTGDLREHVRGHLLVDVVAHAVHGAPARVVTHHAQEEQRGPVLVRAHACEHPRGHDGIAHDGGVRHSASGDRRDERDLVARVERLGERRIGPVHGDGRLGRQLVEGGPAASQLGDEIRHRGPVTQLYGERGRAEEIAVGGEEERLDGNGHSMGGV